MILVYLLFCKFRYYDIKCGFSASDWMSENQTSDDTNKNLTDNKNILISGGNNIFFLEYNYCLTMGNSLDIRFKKRNNKILIYGKY